MKFERQILVPKTIIEEGEYAVVKRTTELSGHGYYQPSGEWEIVALCGEDENRAHRLCEEIEPWYDKAVMLLTYEEIKKMKTAQ